jgi:hypothetical protein
VPTVPPKFLSWFSERPTRFDVADMLLIDRLVIDR